MPIYEYVCVECKSEMELKQPMDQDPPRCPKCGSPRSLNRKISRTEFTLRGSGWYKTDYGSN
jgi:putative FmdB family regulatory protein